MVASFGLGLYAHFMEAYLKQNILADGSVGSPRMAEGMKNLIID